MLHRNRIVATSITMLAAFLLPSWSLADGESAPAIAIAAGQSHACALLKSGAVWCWGLLMSSDGRPTPTPTPLEVQNLPPVRSISAYAATTCAVDLDGNVWCWGLNIQDSISKHAPSISSQPFVVKGLPRAKHASVGWTHACALTETGAASCWGVNSFGEVGNGSKRPVSQPVIVDGVSDLSSIGAGVHSTCAATSDGRVKCWGSLMQSMKPVELRQFVGITKVVNGQDFACGLRKSQMVACWGSNFFNQLGYEDDDSGRNGVIGMTRPTWESIGPVKDIAAGFFSACAVLEDGAVKCWGLKLGSPADPTIPRQLPTRVAGIQNARQIAVGGEFACALLEDEKVTCWGSNNDGQLGDGTTSSSSAPVEVLGMREQ